ncbi:hypothetical protein AAD018_001285 [Aestuariibius insulae]|uniref:hypothetical protein n=1 Tax=Aestuariibius insulae TaxID=2058287 RepID=UPI00345E55E3
MGIENFGSTMNEGQPPSAGVGEAPAHGGGRGCPEVPGKAVGTSAHPGSGASLITKQMTKIRT